MDGNAVLIIVGLIGIAIGFALGVAITSMREPRQVKGDVDTAQIEARIGVPIPPAVTAPAPAPMAVAPLVDLSTPPQPRPITAVDVIARALQPDVRSSESQVRSIAAQIDEILQEMVENSPLAPRGIRLMELPGKGMVVMVGLDQYEGVEAVPDEDIRQLIRAAVAEWERRVAE